MCSTCYHVQYFTNTCFSTCVYIRACLCATNGGISTFKGSISQSLCIRTYYNLGIVTECLCVVHVIMYSTLQTRVSLHVCTFVHVCVLLMVVLVHLKDLSHSLCAQQTCTF